MSLDDLNLATDYRTGSVGNLDPIAAFYLPSLAKSKTYLRAAGYFRSSVLALTGPAFVDFARRGGTAKLICSPKLEPSDVQAILDGQRDYKEALENQIVRDVDDLLAQRSLDAPAATLATLVSLGVVEILIAYRPDADGMYHEKIGCFLDENNNRVSFIGSANETYSAWAPNGNFESVEVFCSWHSSRESARTRNHELYLRNLIANNVPGVAVIDFPDAARIKLFERARSSIDDLQDPPFNESSAEHHQDYSLGKNPLPHQRQAIAAWKHANFRGILEHATGSGKTFTAILAIADHVALNQPAIVVVPSQLLQAQWTKEILEAIPQAIILQVGGGHQRWREPYALAGHTAPGVASRPRITIAVMASASLKEFRAKVVAGPHLLVVVDEVHQIGSREYSQFLELSSGKRLGLSATPTRFGDPEGTQRIFEYFGDVIQPVVTLRDAIESKRLVPYEYHVHAVKLTPEEAEYWRDLTKRIGYALGESTDSARAGRPLSDQLTRLLIKRARIAKKASRKVPVATRIIVEHFKPDQRWLVYCEDIAHMEELSAALSERQIESTVYHSAMTADRGETLRWFERNGGIVIAVRCLDEGIDIPSVTHGLLIASSQNPRQFIQRRGRILRRHADKDKAVLHDLIVLPVDDANDPLGSLESEFSRAVAFANDAMNPGEHATLIGLALENGIDLSKHYQETEEQVDNE